MEFYHPGSRNTNPNGFLRVARCCHGELSPQPLPRDAQHPLSCCSFSANTAALSPPFPHHMSLTPPLLCPIFIFFPPVLKQEPAECMESLVHVRAPVAAEQNQVNAVPSSTETHLRSCQTHTFFSCTCQIHGERKHHFKGVKNGKVEKKQSQARGCLLKPRQNPAGFQSNPRGSRRWESCRVASRQDAAWWS